MYHFFREPVVQALGLTVVLGAFLMLFWALMRGVQHWFVERDQKALKSTSDNPSIPMHATWWHLCKVFCAHLGASALIWVTWGVSGAICFFWLTLILILFPETQPIGRDLESAVQTELVKLGHSFIGSLSNWVMLVVVFTIAKIGVNANQALFHAMKERASQADSTPPEVWHAIRRLISLAIWAVAFVVAYPYLPGANSEALKGLLLMLGTILTLGSTGLANQIMSGLVLIFSRAFKVGDLIIIGSGNDTLEGVVVAITTLNVKISNRLDQMVTVPNQLLISKPIKNFSRKGPPAGNQISVQVSIGYDAAWRQVQALLLEAARRTSGVLQDPKPYVLQSGLGDFYVVYALYCHIAQASVPAKVTSELKANVQDCFNQAQIPIVSPHFSRAMPSPTLAKVPDDLPPLPADAKG